MFFESNFYKSKIQSNEVLKEVVNFLVQRTPLVNIVFVGNIDAKFLENRPSGTTLYFIGDSKVLEGLDTTDLIIFNCNISKGLPKLEKEILNKSIFVLDRVIEEIPNRKKLLSTLSDMAVDIPSILLTTSRVMDLDNLKKVVTNHNFQGGFYGKIPEEIYSEIKENSIYIGGYLSNYKKVDNKDFKVCAIISTYNEEDIIEQVCNYLLKQRIDVHIIDNWSKDGTQDILTRLSKIESRLTWERFPDKDSEQYMWFDVLNRKIQYAKSKDYDWYIHYDADEIRESCWDGTLKEGIERVDELGYNAIDYTVIDFRPVKNGFDNKKDPDGYFKYFEFGRRPGHFAQIKAWKNILGIEYDLSSSGGHTISFDKIKVFPYKFLLKHYPLRSVQHMRKKIFKDRLPRFELEKKEHGWHTHYDQFIGKEKEIQLWQRDNLIEFKDNFYEKYLLERLSGINI